MTLLPTRAKHGARRSFLKRTLPMAVATVLAAACLAGTASAYWATSGTGTGTATTGALTFAVNGLTSAEAIGSAETLFPGESGDLKLRYNNTNAYPVKVVGLTAGAILPESCMLSASLPTTFTDPGYTLQPGPGTLRVPNGVTLDVASPSTCQNTDFTISITVKVQR